MDREILFRGKRVIDGKWIESCCPLGEMHSGTVTYDFDSKTVCQYTGLTDKNGRKIFEGDIVKIGLEQYEVWWNCDSSSLTLSSENESRGLYLSHNETIEVIGNIYDNPDLLEGGEE